MSTMLIVQVAAIVIYHVVVAIVLIELLNRSFSDWSQVCVEDHPATNLLLVL